MRDDIEPQTKPACECTLEELVMEAVRQATRDPRFQHAHFSQNRMMKRNDDGDLVLGDLVFGSFTYARAANAAD